MRLHFLGMISFLQTDCTSGALYHPIFGPSNSAIFIRQKFFIFKFMNFVILKYSNLTTLQSLNSLIFKFQHSPIFKSSNLQIFKYPYFRIYQSEYFSYICTELVNEYSFIKDMARITDENKIEKIKEATIEMVVQKGFGNASISEITRKAGVAEGYLYRHYKGKTELVEDLLYTTLNGLVDKLEDFLQSHHTVPEVIEQLVRNLFELAKKSPGRIKFLYVLMNDYNFRIEESQRERIYNLCRMVKQRGLEMKYLRDDIDEEEIYLIGVTYPIQFINLRLKSFFNRTEIEEPEIEKVIRICKNSLKK
jgi:TetR/AcrR family transcriptional regulator, repressor of fatR-cypB operon